MSLIDKVKNFEFWPEIYVYPTNRSYQKISNFSLKKVQFSHDINLYIHIPFCKQICAYCGYLKIIDKDSKLKEQYVEAIIKEIEMYRDIIQTRNIKTLHFGGGTPSLLSVDQIARIVKHIQSINPNLLTTAQEISIESTPEMVEYDTFFALQQLGINRVSIGLQSLNDNEIALCNRKNKGNVSLEAIGILKKIGFKNIVVDIMIGIEGQTIKSFEQSIDEVIKHKPDTVELYAIGLMPNTQLKTTTKKLMSNEDIYTCYQMGRTKFLAAGYQQDCHNRYAIKDKGGFLQEDYVFQDMSLIGLGAGARSYAINMHYRNNYTKSHRQAIDEYINDINTGILAVKTGISISKTEKIRQYAIYNIEKLHKSDFLKKFGSDFKVRFKKLYTQLLQLDFIQEDKTYIKLNKKGLNYRDLIGKELFSKKLYLIEEQYRNE